MKQAPLNITQPGQLALQSGGIGGWTNLRMGLATALPVSPGYFAGWADFGHASYGGYAAASITFDGGYVDLATNDAYAQSDQATFQGPVAGSGPDVVGALLYDGSDSTVFAWADFDGKVSLLDDTQGLFPSVTLTDANEGVVNLLP